MKKLADVLIIRAAHNMSWLQRLLSRLLTVLWWLLWVYLWLPALAFFCLLIWGEQLLPVTVRIDQLPGHLLALGRYALLVCLFGGGLVLWSRINYWRFSGEEQRGAIANVTLLDMAADLGLEPALLQAGQAGKVVVVHHNPEGGIHHLDILQPLPAGTATPPEPALTMSASLPLSVAQPGKR
ncbi:poly-beta-1,6-N-acetyl-D-glucosamine biosynthesis protein PgaD [Aquitalea magnusonii]|uniref:Biofilm PGA synthesis protein PgaD n=1 Tax=Aquitalea magnusonii TaxID=332411 RepID=A0A318IY68_9NEIS|nr:poly-beta-1,6-N-acetyl-D-glucosamine biosynthesis protein PgaD [Aquitalea magnusonii]PXX40144.1 biofilm PGA synthesis protein PgaD [Aquitalea magnusonii]